MRRNQYITIFHANCNYKSNSVPVFPNTRLSAGYKMPSANDYKPSDSRNVVLNFYTGGGNLFSHNVFKLLKDAF